MDQNEEVSTPNTTEIGGVEKEPVNTTETEKKQVEEVANTSQDNKQVEDVKKPGNEKTQVEKTFTQTELNSVVENRISRLEAKHKKEMEELEARYKNGDYSPEMKNLQEQLTTERAKTAELQNQLVRYEIDNAFMQEGVADEFKEFVEYKVLRMVTEEKDFANCLKEFKQQGENSKFFKDATGGKAIVPPRPKNSSESTEQIASERKLEKSMGL